MTEGHILDWDDAVRDGTGSLLLADGDYNFEVVKFERGTFPGSRKIPACGKAVYYLEIRTEEGSANIREELILYSSLEFRIADFFRALGMKKRGEENWRPDWQGAVGRTGRCTVGTHEFTGRDGSTHKVNRVTGYYDAAPELEELEDTEDLPF